MYRVCGNFPDLNSCTKIINYFIPGCKSIADRFYRSWIYSSVDVKAGFMNILVSERTRRLLGIVTQDGVFRALRMMFGLDSAPFFF
jgi:hypothetical protein